MKRGALLTTINPRGTSSECSQCYAEIVEKGYRTLKCPQYGFEADRDVVGKLNIRRRALRILRISGGSLITLTAPK
jgi:transposase